MQRKIYTPTWLLMFIFLLLPSLFSYVHAQQVYANSQTVSVNGLCLLCGVTNPNNAVDSNLENYSEFSVPAQLLGAKVSQTLIFPTGSTGGCDSLILRVGSSYALTAASFAAITVRTYNGNTPNADSISPGASQLQFLPGNNQVNILLKPAATFDRVVVTYNAGIIALLGNFRIYYAMRKRAIDPPFTIPASDTAICNGSAVQLSPVLQPGFSYKWYDAASGGNEIPASSGTYAITVSPATTSNYYVAGIANTCVSERKAVQVVVHPLPANPVYTVPQGRICGDNNITVSNYVTGLNYKVKVNYTGSGNLNYDTSYTVTNSSVVMVKDLAYYFNATAKVSIQAQDAITGCVSDTVTMTFIFGGHAAPTRVTGDSAVICKGDTTVLNANLFNDPNGTNLAIIKWYDAASGGNLLQTGHNLSVHPDSTTTYYVTAAFECDYPVRTPAKVIVRKLPAPAFTTPQGVVCGPQSLPVSNHQPSWQYTVRTVYRSFLGILADTTYQVKNTATITTPAIYPQIPVDVDVYVQTKDTVSGCRSDTIHMIYSMGGASKEPAVDNDSITICSGDTAILHVFVPGSSDNTIRYKWYDAPTGGNLLYSGAYFSVSPATTTVYYGAAGYECEYPVRKQVVVTVNTCAARAMAMAMKPAASEGLELYPNPTRGLIVLPDWAKFTGARFELRNLRGTILLQGTVNGNTIQLPSNIPAGSYMLQVIPRDKPVSSGKIILIR